MAKKHIHKYHKVDTEAGPLWACGLGDCNHFMPSHYAKLLPGKTSICWGCGELFTLDPISMERSKPMCGDCQFGELSKELDRRMAIAGKKDDEDKE